MIARIVLLAALALGGLARADDAKAHARALYDRGMGHYNVGEFDAAAEDFKQAYQLTRAPGLLFNLAQACRLAHKNEEALRFYRTYLREKPNAVNKKDVKAFIALLEKMPAPAAPAPPPANETSTAAGDKPPPDKEVEPAPEPPARVEAPSPPPPAHTEAIAPVHPVLVAPVAKPASVKPYVVAAAVLGGVGVAALGTAAYFAVASRDASSEITGASAWTPGLQQRWDDGQRDAQVATALFVVGGVSAGVAVVLGAVAARKHAKKLALIPSVGPGAVGWSCAF
jgi:tetratricopeptide (TPR) repeat protein